MLPSEQRISILSCPQNQSHALLNSVLLTINIPFVLANGISNPLCINLEEFAAPPQKLIKISKVVLSGINYLLFPMLFLFKNASLRYMKTIHCIGLWHRYIYLYVHVHIHVCIYIAFLLRNCLCWTW